MGQRRGGGTRLLAMEQFVPLYNLVVDQSWFQFAAAAVFSVSFDFTYLMALAPEPGSHRQWSNYMNLMSFSLVCIALFPTQAPHCEHAFCNACITQWFSQQQTCPVDRSVVTVAHLRPVPRIMRNMLSKLQITCDNAVFGCTAIVRLDNLMSHLNDCEHNPKRPVTCEQGCGWVLTNIRQFQPQALQCQSSVNGLSKGVASSIYHFDLEKLMRKPIRCIVQWR